jgi:uncharacterized protein (TIGR03435 family)
MRVNTALLAGTMAIGLATASLYKAEPQSRAPLAFEVASIKPNATGDNRVQMQVAPGGRMNMTGVTMKLLIRNAFRIQDFQIVGGPGWMEADRWDIQTKAEENASPVQVNEMLQTLLADRFQLKFHKETRELPVYELVVAKGGQKLQETRPDGPPVAGPRGESLGRGTMVVGRGQLAGSGMTMAQLSTMLANTLGRTVIDKTGLTGNYDVKLSWTPEPGQGGLLGGAPPPPAPVDPDATAPSIFTAIQEQLGLKIDSGKGPVDVYVIDRVEKPATEQQ